MRVLAPQYSDEVAAVLSYPVVTVAAIYSPFAAQQDAGEARWGALVNTPDAVAAQPPPQLPPGTGEYLTRALAYFASFAAAFGKRRRGIARAKATLQR